MLGSVPLPPAGEDGGQQEQGGEALVPRGQRRCLLQQLHQPAVVLLHGAGREGQVQAESGRGLQEGPGGRCRWTDNPVQRPFYGRQQHGEEYCFSGGRKDSDTSGCSLSESLLDTDLLYSNPLKSQWNGRESSVFFSSSR